MSESIKEKTFETAALPHIDDLFRTALRVIGNRSEAEDLLQETYLQAWKSFHRFEVGTNCRAWLFKILFHVIHHHRRKWFGFASKLVDVEEGQLENTIAWEPPVPQSISDEDVLAALSRVPVQYREVVLLADVEELSYKEIAEALTIPIGTVMSRLSRGRKILRAELAEAAPSLGVRSLDSVRAIGA